MGSLIVAVTVGALIAWALNELDDHCQIEEKLIEFLEKSQQEVGQLARKISEIEVDDVFWDMAAAYLDGMLEKGKKL